MTSPPQLLFPISKLYSTNNKQFQYINFKENSCIKETIQLEEPNTKEQKNNMFMQTLYIYILFSPVKTTV